MRIEVFYFPGCPHYEAALETIKRVLSEECLDAQVIPIEIVDEHMAADMHFLGSPTIRVNGLDIDPAAPSTNDRGLYCRTYMQVSGSTGAPPPEMIRHALRSGR